MLKFNFFGIPDNPSKGVDQLFNVDSQSQKNNVFHLFGLNQILAYQGHISSLILEMSS